MKISVVVSGVLVVLFLVLQFFIKPVQSAVLACFETELAIMNTVYDQAQAMELGEARREYLCTADIESMDSIRDCLRQAKTKSLLGDILVNEIPQKEYNPRKRLAYRMRDHNWYCPDMPLADERL